MAEKIPMLALSPTMDEGTIVSWLKEVGDSISSGDVLCEVETDKATMEYETQAEGTLLAIQKKVGDKAKVGDTIAIIGEEGEDISSLTKDEPAPAEKAEQKEEPEEKLEKESEETEEEAEEAPEKQTSTKDEEKPEKKDEVTEKESDTEAEAKPKEAKKEVKSKNIIKASPLARNLASERGIDLSSVTGSGPDGRITKQDIEKASPATSPKSQINTEGINAQKSEISQKRKIIAERLSASKFSAPHYYLKTKVDADSLMNMKEKVSEHSETKVSYNAIIMKLAALVLKKHPQINSGWAGDSILNFNSADIGLAVAQEEGLITPIVRNCESKGIAEIQAELDDLIAKAREGKLSEDQYTNPSFTISNLGMYDIDEFTAIINPPASCILAIGKIISEPCVVDEEIVIGKTLKLTLSCDHRVVDGAVGAAFLTELKTVMECPVWAIA